MTGWQIIEDDGAAQVPASDRGLQYGDGLFETLACRDGQPRFLRAHLDRLARGCDRLGFPGVPLEPLESAITRAAGAPAAARSLVKLLVTRGSSPQRGYAPPAGAAPLAIVQAHPWPANTETGQQFGVAASFSAVPLTENRLLAGIKHLNRLDSVLARAALAGTGCAEALLRAADGAVVCGSMSNLFVWRAGRLVTPPVDRGGIAGIARAAILGLARDLGWQAAEAVLHPADVDSADEVFLSNVRIGVWPVVELGARRWPVGERTRVLQRLFETLAG